MALSLQQLKKRRDSVEAYLINESKRAHQDAKAKVSAFWQEFFDQRKNFLNLKELLVFLRTKDHKGIATDAFENPEDEKNYFFNALKMVAQYSPPSFIDAIEEPIFGSPPVFDYSGRCNSATFIVNNGTTWSCKRFVDKYLAEKSNIVALEIGAGYGAVSYQLQSAIPAIKSYTICDLPENMFLSSLYLQNAFTQKDIVLVDQANFEKKIQTIEQNTLYFTLPQFLESFDCRFDLFINTFSFQEMDLESVVSYIHWVENHLSESGICYFINSHNKVGIKNASQYGYQRFNILSLQMFRKTPDCYFSSIPYEVVLARPQKRQKEFDPALLDALCDMMQLGIGDNITGYCDSFVSGDLPLEDCKFLKSIGQLFKNGSISEKIELSSKIVPTGNLQLAIYSYIYAVLYFVNGSYSVAEELFEKSLRLGLSGFAKTRALTNLLFIKGKLNKVSKIEIERMLVEIDQTSPSLLMEIKESLSNLENIQFHRRDYSQRFYLDFQIPLLSKLRRRISRYFMNSPR